MFDYTFKVFDKVQINPIVKKVRLFTLIVFGLLIIMLFLPWQQTVRGTGKVVAYNPMQRDYSIDATMDGFIETFYVQENQFVTKGTKLFKIVDIDKSYLERLKTIEGSSRQQHENSQLQVRNDIDNRKNLQEYLKIGLNIYEQKHAQIQNKIDSLKHKKISIEKNFEIEKSNVERTRLLHADGIKSQRTLEVQENSYVKARAELKRIEIDINIEQNNLDIIMQEQKKFSKDTENKITALDNSRLTSENKIKTFKQDIQRHAGNVSRYTSGEVVAEKDGYVVRILQNDKHKFIKKGEMVMSFSPTVSQKSILLKVSDFNMPLIKAGLPARIMFYGWPAMQVAGWPKITFGTFGGVIKKVERTSSEDGFYYAQVLEDPKEPWPDNDVLRMGTRATVWVRLSTVPIWYQLWRLMNALPPEMKKATVEENL